MGGGWEGQLSNFIHNSMLLTRREIYTLPCAGQGIFVRGGGGGPGQSYKKSLTTFFFFFFFLVLSLFYRSQMVNFKKIYHFLRFQRGSNIFQGVQLFPGGGGGVQLRIPYRNPLNL